jgi:transcriptional regulator with XRE-family HTH domain
MSEVQTDPKGEGPQPPPFRPGGDVERELLLEHPGARRLADAVGRRKRLLGALANWRSHVFGLSQAELATRLGCAQPDVSRLELGKVDPRLSTLERYAAALDANFFWQMLDDYGVPVQPDFTWSADVRFAREFAGELSAPTHDIRDVAGMLARALSSGDLNLLASLYAPGAFLSLPGGRALHGQEAIAKYRAVWHEAFDEADWSFQTPVAEGHVVISPGTFSGLPRRGLADLELDPTGRLEQGRPTGERVKLAFQEWLVVEDGNIVEDHWLFDRADILEQLSPAPAYA